MAEEVRIWQVESAGELAEIKGSEPDREERLQKWISRNISLLSDELLVIGEQVKTASRGKIDFLCLETWSL